MPVLVVVEGRRMKDRQYELGGCWRRPDKWMGCRREGDSVASSSAADGEAYLFSRDPPNISLSLSLYCRRLSGVNIFILGAAF